MKRIALYLLTMLLLAACNNRNSQPPIFKDRKVEKAVRAILRYNDDQQIQLKDLNSITKISCPHCSDLSGLRYLGNLETVGITFSSVRDFSELYRLKKLKYLYVYYCKISDIRFLSQLNDIDFLYLDDNRIEDISPIGSLKQLKILSLCHNKIKDISVLSKLTKIESIYMSDNSIEQLPDFSHCINLKELDLQNNRFICNENFYKLKRVKTIWLGFNRINNADWVTSLDSIHNVNLRDNPIDYKKVYANRKLRRLIDNEILELDTVPRKIPWWAKLINYCFD